MATATPIQTRPEDIWDLLSILHQVQGRFVLGHDFTPWHRPREVLPLLAGTQEELGPSEAWNLLHCPLPLTDFTLEPRARRLCSAIRQDLGLDDKQWQTNRPWTDLTLETREILEEELERHLSGASFFQRENPLVRHVVLRKRSALEQAGLLDKVGVDVHPDRRLSREEQPFTALFEGEALRTGEDFRAAYAEAREFGRVLAKSGLSGGFLRNLMEQRICSSIVAGVNTARTVQFTEK
ncbi:MAG: hypothetical protein EA399_02565 [Desulfovibrionales bacterium]|nr:MAG: hypothetical protein EA399_02565 [Desulfovibrionales bacterium]